MPWQRAAAEAILKAFQEDSQAWTKVDSILEQAKLEQTKFFGLQVRRRFPAHNAGGPTTAALPCSASSHRLRAP